MNRSDNQPNSNKSVLIVEFSEFRHDARVAKEVNSIKNLGFNTTLIMFSEYVKHKTIINEERLISILYPFHNKKGKGYLGRCFWILCAFVVVMRIWFQVLKARADYFHVHNLFFLIPAYIKTRLISAKIIYDAHELHSEHQSNSTTIGRILNTWNYYYEGFFIRRVDVVIEASQERAEYVRDIYKIKEPFVINNHALVQDGTEEKVLHKMAKLPESAKILLYTGGVYGNRRLDKTIEALSKMSHFDIYLVIVGFMSARARERINSIVHKYGVEKKVIILPPVNSSQVVEVASTADVGIIPLYGDSVNTKLSALNKVSEYLMAGLPMICTNYHNLSKIVYSNSVGQVGETFEVEDSSSIKLAIEKVLKSRAAFSKNARELALKEYNWNREEAKLKSIYEKEI